MAAAGGGKAAASFNASAMQAAVLNSSNNSNASTCSISEERISSKQLPINSNSAGGYCHKIRQMNNPESGNDVKEDPFYKSEQPMTRLLSTCSNSLESSPANCQLTAPKEACEENSSTDSEALSHQADLFKKIEDATPEGQFFLKLLLPNQLATVLTTNNEEQIRVIKNHTKAGMVLAPSGKCYPGTTDRVLAVFAYSEVSCLTALELILDLQRRVQAPINNRMETSSTIKIAVPRSVIGSVIGKKGAYIQAIRMETGAIIHVSSLFVPPNEVSPERVISITSCQRENILAAAYHIARKINEHEKRSSCRNVIYLRKVKKTKVENEDDSHFLNSNKPHSVVSSTLESVERCCPQSFQEIANNDHGGEELQDRPPLNFLSTRFKHFQAYIIALVLCTLYLIIAMFVGTIFH